MYILKETRKGKFDVKSDEGIFLGYFSKIKSYKCLNITTHKVIESAHVKIDKFTKKSEEQSSKEPKTIETLSTLNLILYLKFKKIQLEIYNLFYQSSLNLQFNLSCNQ